MGIITLQQFRSTRALPVDVKFGDSVYTIGVQVFKDPENQRMVYGLGAEDMNPNVWLRRNELLADTFFLSRGFAEDAFARGFTPGDQESGEMGEALYDIVSAMLSSGTLARA